MIAVVFGSYGSGILPGQDGAPLDGWGIVPVEAWILAALVYVVLVGIFARGSGRERVLGFPEIA